MLEGYKHDENVGGWPSNEEMMHFCQPARIDEPGYEEKLMRSAEEFDIPFEGQTLKGYRWGTGKTVLLVHGWNSRAAHMAFLARILAKSGYMAVALDGPAHGRSLFNGSSPRTSLPEFCRAIYHVANRIGTIYAVIGHSFGAAASAFCLAGQANLAGYRIEAEKLVMISSPPGIRQMIEHYCHTQGFREGAVDVLVEQLEYEFPIVVREYEISNGLGQIEADILVVHDIDDLEIGIEDVRAMINGHTGVNFVCTQGEGHRRILVSRSLVKAVKNFL